MEMETSNGSIPAEEAHTSLIHGLPDDLALLCLARVPRTYHHVLKCVSKRWKALLCSDVWYSCRQNLQLAESWVYAFCRDSCDCLCIYVLDPSRRCWKHIKDPPIPCMKRYGMAYAVLERKLYLLGGCGESEDASDDAYCYDALTDTWEKVASLLVPRCHFACEALDGCLYAVGGMGLTYESLQTWEIYDPHVNSWQCSSDPSIPSDIGESAIVNGKMYIRHISPDIVPNSYAAMFDLSDNKWHPVDNEMVMGWRGPAVVVGGSLYVLDQTSGIKLMTWKEETREWALVGRLSTLFTKPPCCVAAIGKRIFVIGKGLNTVVIDTQTAGRIQGIMLCTSIPGLVDFDDLVVSCKTISI
ncbi:F-box/kelch-repeat protein SKIP4 [Nymphaea colorata]|nr:F-box/kelch-repeat protein SKIP4 [Nymphaea colorata]XP_031503422.1 F-box/kelch-repeat protein SKIP4 [Nymphaea colorata]XP_031503423.1 F-box/kelch-repeat protein SKIP4 [Nymphaea colorata]